MIPLLLSLATAKVVPDDRVALEVEVDGALVELPLTTSTMRADLDGDIASVTLVQTFANPGAVPADARYVFPLPSDAAVHRMRMTAGDQVIEAVIQEKAEAQATFDAAKSEGKQASLLEQHRPNVFTQQLANLPPGEEVSITLEYAHAVPREDGVYRYVFPMVVGPRYDEAGAAPSPTSTIEPGRIDVAVDLNGVFDHVRSPSHAITSHGGDRVLDETGPIANRDFVLEYTYAGATARPSTYAWAEDGEGVVSLLIEPPLAAPDADVTPRELVFLLDTSCSMGGVPMESSKAFMREMLAHTRPTDTFRIHRFGSSVEELSSTALPATDKNLERGREYIDGLSADGGTRMMLGLKAALEPAPDPERMRIVVFLTDGYIGSDFEVLALVDELRGDSRIFALGIGDSVNRYLLEEVARTGHGSARIVLDPSKAAGQAKALAQRLQTPYLTDVRIDWGGAPISGTTPSVVPDLFLGDSLRVMARYSEPGTWPVTVHGEINGKPATLPMNVELPATTEGSEALPVLWARSQIADRMIDWTSARTDASEKAAIQQQITDLGLEHRLVTQWTSFVAVAPDAPAVAAAQPVQKATPSYSGSAAPEPETWAVLIALSMLSMLIFGRRRALG